MEEDLEELPEVSRIHFLLSGLNTQVSTQILLHDVPKTFQGLCELAMKIEKLLKQNGVLKQSSAQGSGPQKKSEDDSSTDPEAGSSRGRGGGSRSSRRRRRGQNQGPATGVNAIRGRGGRVSKSNRDLSKIQCWNCEENEHYANACPHPKEGNSRGQ